MRKMDANKEKKDKMKKIAGRTAYALMAATFAIPGTAIPLWAEEPDLSVIPLYSTLPGPSSTKSLLSWHYATPDIFDDTYDLDEMKVEEGKLSITIKKNGKYRLTGSNLREGAYIDTQITVEQGVTADLYFDNLQIVNDDHLDLSSLTTSFFSTDGVPPIVVNGKANVHLIGSSTIQATDEFFKVDGELNFVDGAEDASLEIGLSEYLTKGYYSLALLTIAEGKGKICFQGGKVTINTYTANEEEYRNSKIGCAQFEIDTPDLVVSKKNSTLIIDSSLYIGTFLINVECSKNYDELNPSAIFSNCEYICRISEVNGLPANAEIRQINDIPVSGISTNEEGKIYNICLPCEGKYTADFYIGDKVYRYGLYAPSSDYCLRPNPKYGDQWITDACTITYVDYDSGETIQTCQAITNEKLTFPSSDVYDYTFFNESGEPIDVADWKPTSDARIRVKRISNLVTLCIDGNTQEVKKGSALPTLSYPCVDEDDTRLYFGGEIIEDDLNLTSIPLDYEVIEGDMYLKVSSADDLMTFTGLVNRGFTTVNCMLTANIDMSAKSSFIGIGSEENPYHGIFDGNGKAITLKITAEGDNHGLFSVATNGITVRNLVVKGSVSGTNHCAGMIGMGTFTRGSAVMFTNCVNEANVSVTNAYAGGFCGYAYYSDFSDRSGAILRYNDCGNKGTISGADYVYGFQTSGESVLQAINCFDTSSSGMFAGSSLHPYSIVENCYDRIGNFGVTKMDDSAFSSGEVTYLLNRKDGSTWFQTCGTGTPMLFGDASTQTVYAYYADCEDVTLSYSNTQQAHTQPGHKDKGETYTFANGKIHAACEYCSTDVTADVTVSENDVYGGTLQGVTVTRSETWNTYKYPDIQIQYVDTNNVATTEAPSVAGTWQVKALVGEKLVDTGLAYTIAPAPIETVSFTAPTASAGKDVTSGSLTVTDSTRYEGAFTWDTEDTVFDYNKQYTAEVTLTAKTNYAFAEDTVLPDGWSATEASTAETLILRHTYTKTEMAKILSVTAPIAEKIELEEFLTEEEVLALLDEKGPEAGMTVERIGLDSGETLPVSVTWTLKGDSFSDISEETNIFVWTIDADEYTDFDTNGAVLSGELEVANPKHEHTYVYSSEGSAFYVVCAEGGQHGCECDEAGRMALTISVNTEDGNVAHGDKVSDLIQLGTEEEKAAWQTLDMPELVGYYSEGELLAAEPEDIGSYTVKYTLEGQTVEVAFCIVKNSDELNQEAADAVMAKIKEIGIVSYSDQALARIDEAKAAYDQLTDEQKALVSNADALTASEKQYEELKAADEAAKKAAEEEAAAKKKANEEKPAPSESESKRTTGRRTTNGERNRPTVVADPQQPTSSETQQETDETVAPTSVETTVPTVESEAETTPATEAEETSVTEPMESQESSTDKRAEENNKDTKKSKSNRNSAFVKKALIVGGVMVTAAAACILIMKALGVKFFKKH